MSISVIIVLFSIVSIQSGASLSKSLLPGISAADLTMTRLGFSAIVLCCIFKPWRLLFNSRKVLLGTAYGLSLAGMNYFFYSSIKIIPLGVAVGIEFVGPMMLIILHRLRPLSCVWISLVMTGLYFLLQLDSNLVEVSFLGVTLAAIAGFFWGVYILVSRKASREHGPMLMSLGLLIGSIIFVPISIVYSGSSDWDSTTLLAPPLVALLSSTLPCVLEMIALARLPLPIFSVLMSFEPVVATICGVVLVGEHLVLEQYCGLLAITCAAIGAILTLHE